MHLPAPSLIHAGHLCVASVQFAYWLLWGGSLALSLTLVILLWTRWGQSQPLHKCAALSIIVHLLLAFLTMTVRIVNGDGGGSGGGGPIHVRIIEEAAAPAAQAIANDTQAAATETLSSFAPPPLLPAPSKKKEPEAAPEVEESPSLPEAAPLVADVAPEESVKPIVETKLESSAPPAPTKPETSEANATPTAIQPSPSPQTRVADASSTAEVSSPNSKSTKTEPTAAPVQKPAAVAEVATADTVSPYSLRGAPGRLGVVAGQGGNAETEAAVAAALRWLAAAQDRDGRWNAVQFGAGREEMVLGQNRGGAGRNADTGITALALLAFLGAGHSHVQGAYQENVRRGLDFVLRSQAADGNLFGDATLYAQMYCHSMAAFALAEAQAVTGDQRLQAGVIKATNFSLAAQNSTTGGWRYRPGDTGDTSQLGWQIMALASAERAGIDVPDQTWNRVERFLHTVQRGSSGGLASYRPDSPASTSMTAEALYCRLLLEEMCGVRLAEPACAEATAQLLATPPTAERVNLYYWYYATLALHHRQHASEAAKTAWRNWNEAMTAALMKTQLTDGKDAGSWSANTIWGGYGGRVYTTAMAAMCLEVYYRYAPAPPRADTWSASRPQTQSKTR
jgi:hypothetical protein